MNKGDWGRILGIALWVMLAIVPVESQQMDKEHLYLKPEEYNTLNEMFHVHINYFLSSDIITAFGLPMTAYKVGNRARFGYSNPTEWGYAMEAWIAASERGVISRKDAASRLKTALTTLDSLQRDPEQNYKGLFYPYYKMTDPKGRDLPMPYHDPNPNIPSGDNALLYASLIIVEGWAERIGDTELSTLARTIRERMAFRIFLNSHYGKLYLAHTLDAHTGELSRSRWDIFADEGGVVTWIAYFSNSITFREYLNLTNCQYRKAADWKSCKGVTYHVAEAPWFNAMFTWGVRSLAGFPIGSFDSPVGVSSTYSRESFVPAVQAHLAFGDCLGVDYPAFSDAMSQAEHGRGLVGWLQDWYIPPNIPGRVMDRPPRHIVPHAFFVPFNALPDMPPELIKRLIAEIQELKQDAAGYYHDSGEYPFGFEVIASPYRDDIEYAGADDGRNVFETLSEAYIVLSLFNALQLDQGKPTFVAFAMKVPQYTERLIKVLWWLYPLASSFWCIDTDGDRLGDLCFEGPPWIEATPCPPSTDSWILEFGKGNTWKCLECFQEVDKNDPCWKQTLFLCLRCNGCAFPMFHDDPFWRFRCYIWRLKRFLQDFIQKVRAIVH